MCFAAFYGIMISKRKIRGTSCKGVRDMRLSEEISKPVPFEEATEMIGNPQFKPIIQGE